MRLDFSDSGEKARLRVLLPGGAKARSVLVDGKPASFEGQLNSQLIEPGCYTGGWREWKREKYSPAASD